MARSIWGVFLVFGLLCGGMSLAIGQEAGEGKPDKERVKEEKKEEPAAEEKAEEKPLTDKEYGDLMDKQVKGAWNKLKINGRKKMGDQAAAAADELAKVAVQILRYDGQVLNGENKGRKARDQKDFKQWVADLKKYAEEYATHARKGDWDKADKSKDQINETCGACHDEYEPVK
jgi:hypothetical protein